MTSQLINRFQLLLCTVRDILLVCYAARVLTPSQWAPTRNSHPQRVRRVNGRGGEETVVCAEHQAGDVGDGAKVVEWVQVPSTSAERTWSVWKI